MRTKCMKVMLLAILVVGVSCSLTGCFGKDDATTETSTTSTDGGSGEDDVSDAVDDAADAVDDAAEDVANGFDNYDDAHDYLINRLGENEDNGQYDVKKREDKVTEYKDGSKGYHYAIYDSTDASGKKFGDFYVDKDNGKIYKKNTKTNKIEEYGSNDE